MNILLVAINAKFIHSSLAVLNLRGSLKPELQQHVKIMEFTINQGESLILSEIYHAKPHAIAFSCYIWNIELVRALIGNLKKILPHVPIIIGGPEITAPEEGVDIAVVGEGEGPFASIVQGIVNGETLHSINTSCPHLPLEDIPFAYPQGFDAFTNRILYYETSRGCANKCGYCLSSATEGVRFLPLARVESDLARFLCAGVKQVKFVDRTFNCAAAHAMAIWAYLIKHDNGFTNFHFEIAGEFLTDEAFELLATARQGLFQFEMGVQTTNAQTLQSINRATNTTQLLENARRVMSLGNIHLHLDLIVGLPYEGYESFSQSFNDVFLCYPHKLQVGFLKVLKGSQLHGQAALHGIKYSSRAPYQVLETKYIKYAQVDMIHNIEHMVETFYNACGFFSSIRYLVQCFSTPFNFFEKLAVHWHACSNHLVSHKKAALYTFLHDFAQTYLPCHLTQLCELLKYDMLQTENVRLFPAWISAYYTPNNKQITRNSAQHSFLYDVVAYKNAPQLPLKKQDTVVQFEY